MYLVACAFVVIIIIVGLSFESKMQIVLMVILYATIFDYIIGTVITPSEYQQQRGVTGYKSNILM